MRIPRQNASRTPERPPEPLQPIETAPANEPRQSTFTQAELVTTDFTGWPYAELPFGVVKAARYGGPATITAKIECVECKRPMWACNPELENLCEEDDYFLRSRNWDLRAERAKANNMRPINPFAESEEPTHTFWPLDED